MRTFWLFRSNIKELEYYHQYTNLDEFVKNCHDFYMLLPIWLIGHGYIDSAIIWRLTNKPKDDIIFDIDGKKYIQRWVTNFNEVFKEHPPSYSLFRGGFPEYCEITKQKPDHFGKKLYLGTGKRIYSQYGGIYDYYLQEDDRDFSLSKSCIPFYKTASPEIFKPLNDTKIRYDICWPANFSQEIYKGQEFFINIVGHCPHLKKLKIIHCGNKPEVGKKMAYKYNVSNINFVGSVDRPTLNKYLNESKFGLVMSNRQDGCPRVITEILSSGTPLFISSKTRLLNFYKKLPGVLTMTDNKVISRILNGINNYENIRKEIRETIKVDLSFENICQKNIEIWKNFR